MHDLPFKSVTSIKYLTYLLEEDLTVLEELAETYAKFYFPWKKKKKNSSKSRQIEPTRSKLKHVQKKINDRILKKYPLPKNVIGGVKDKTVKDNARMHLKQSVVVALDIKSCFPSIKNTMVFDMFRKEFGFSSNITSILTRLTTYRGHIPQGAPTSTSLANLCLLPMHRDIENYCIHNGLNYTLWVDDITISGEAPHEHIASIIEIIMSHKQRVSNRKIIVMPANIRQEVTGVIVNSFKPTVPIDKMKKYKRTVIISNDKEEFRNKLIGQLGHVGFINPNQKRHLEKLAKKKLKLN